MKEFTVDWRVGDTSKEKKGRGSVCVIADSLTKAIARFQKEYHPGRVIDAVYTGCDEVLLDEREEK